MVVVFFFGAVDDNLNITLFLDDNIKEVVNNYTTLTGKMEMPPHLDT